MFSNTDKDWEAFGKNDPYYGVVSHSKFRKENLTDSGRDEFFATGSDHLNSVLDTIRKHIDPNLTINRSLDFGCGVGRIVVPLSRISKETTGIDVSESMLTEARRNCESLSIKNAFFEKSDDNLSCLKGTYDFIHSFIVFQHIPVARGERMFKRLLEHLQEGGVCAAHFTYEKATKFRRFASTVRKYIPLSANFINLIKGRSFFEPQMQMNSYSINRLFHFMQSSGTRGCHIEYTNHGDELGVIIYFKK